MTSRLCVMAVKVLRSRSCSAIISRNLGSLLATMASVTLSLSAMLIIPGEEGAALPLRPWLRGAPWWRNAGDSPRVPAEEEVVAAPSSAGNLTASSCPPVNESARSTRGLRAKGFLAMVVEPTVEVWARLEGREAGEAAQAGDHPSGHLGGIQGEPGPGPGEVPEYGDFLTPVLSGARWLPASGRIPGLPTTAGRLFDPIEGVMSAPIEVNRPLCSGSDAGESSTPSSPPSFRVLCGTARVITRRLGTDPPAARPPPSTPDQRAKSSALHSSELRPVAIALARTPYPEEPRAPRAPGGEEASSSSTTGGGTSPTAAHGCAAAALPSAGRAAPPLAGEVCMLANAIVSGIEAARGLELPRRVGSSGARSSGSSKRMVVPRSTPSDLTAMVPPYASTNVLVMCSPSPVPPPAFSEVCT
mmetsp:Transcript_56592/g.178890  ORF Transcript_56592/g.178890 Transcript_56592/m.178890 type:complete len:416 (-) Transcript_56592:84-1331(-)